MRIDSSKYLKSKNVADSTRARRLNILSRLATITCISMYVSYIPQIISNFSGHPVSPVQPIFACVNACLWVGYGWLKDTKDWPVIIANAPGIVFGLITMVTVYVH